MKKKIIISLFLALSISQAAYGNELTEANLTQVEALGTEGNLLEIKEIVEEEKLFLDINGNRIDPLVVNGILSIDNEIIYSGYPVLHENKFYIPLRAFADFIGGELLWDSDTKEIELKKDRQTILFPEGSSHAVVNGELKEMRSPLIKKDSITYVDSVFLAESMGYDLVLNTESIIISPENAEKFLLIKNNIPIMELTEKKDKVRLLFENKKGTTKERTILNPFDSVSFNSDEVFIYNNFPESILGNAFKETYVNKTNNVIGKGRVFASHANHSGRYMDYVIRVENASGAPCDFKYVLDAGVERSDEYIKSIEIVEPHLKSFYDKILNEEYEEVTIPSGGFIDIPVIHIGSNKFFTIQMDFETKNAVNITSFAMEHISGNDFSKYETPNIPYDYDYVPTSYKVNNEGLNADKMYYSVYSGIGNGYTVNTKGKIEASQLEDKNLGYETGLNSPNNLNELMGINELMDIILVTPRGENNEITKATWVGNVPYVNENDSKNKNLIKNYTNLGNWGVEYNISTDLVNDTSEEKTFVLNILVPHISPIAVIAEGEVYTIADNNKEVFHTLSRKNIDNSNEIRITNKISVWEILEVTLPAYSEKTVDYKYALGTDGNSSVYHFWETR